MTNAARDVKPRGKKKKKTVIQTAWEEWISHHLSASERATLATTLGASEPSEITFNMSYLKYDNVVMLQQKTLQKPPLSLILKVPELRCRLPRFWEAVGRGLRVGHVGVTAPIPLNIDEGDFEVGSADTKTDANGSNVMRSPTSFQALYGSFGKSEAAFSAEAAEDTFWAQATQHGITQVWSPLHTMFSNGNISEKARVMSFEKESHTTAVDLYAGIGYFALFYRRYVADVVLGWEINPWSVEGFQRGAAANGWSKETAIVRANSAGEDDVESSDRVLRTVSPTGLTVFQESNEMAVERVKKMKHLPPIRHVNCGYLPSSFPSWGTAVHLILRAPQDLSEPEAKDVYGWVHAHENVAVQDIEDRTAVVVAHFAALVDDQIRALGWSDVCSHVSCPYVAQVKTYAPGIMHCVLDVRIDIVRRVLG